MIFTLEALEAQHGDALLLHYGDAGAPRVAMIDAGPRNTFTKRVKPRLDQLVATRADGGRLPIPLLMVSHIDDDHIQGVLDFLDLLDQDESAPYSVDTLWHNAFDDIIGNAGTASLATLAQVQGASVDTVLANVQLGSRESQAVLANVGQGRRLAALARKLNLNRNTPFEGLVAGPPHEPVDLGGGLSLTVVGPSAARLDALQEEWDKDLAKAKAKGAKPQEMDALVAAYLDTSAANLSSIVVLARAGGKSMLLTGDARGDYVLEGLEAAGLMTDGHIHVNVLKMPHHGSFRDVAPDFFERITADHYVISANGKYDNPDLATLRLLSQVRGGESITVHLTNRVAHAAAFLDSDAQKKGYGVVYRDDPALSVRVELGDPLPD